MPKRSEYRILNFGGLRRKKKTGSTTIRIDGEKKNVETFLVLGFLSQMKNIRKK